MADKRGLFLTLEGAEGVGKSTNIGFITAHLEENGIEYILTREPGGTLIAEEIRELLLAVHDESMSELSELLLIFAARAQHLEAKIEPALAAGKWVVCDRFTDATFAYQGYGRRLSIEKIEQLQTMVQGTLRPDLTIILDLDPSVGMERASNRGELDRIEQEQQSFFHRVRQGYLDIAKAEPERCVVIDASKPLEQVKLDLLKVLKQGLAKFA
ncbi:MAG: dTMP kinase [Gammaproteobacteria bacterium]|jgi:dTMP kinase|nr:dTMP kinase [Gammaproteobacteria bacterium]